ncbi:hypothetical protein K8I31_12760 [bacterium]|nr:hypothetical protein [bacterium]
MNHPGVYVCEDVAQVGTLHASILNDGFYQLTIQEQLRRLAINLHNAHNDLNSACAVQLKNCFPNLIGKPMQEIMAARFSLADAQHTIAREYGYKNWLQVEQLGDKNCNGQFEHAVDAVVHGEIESLRKMLKETPALSSMRSCYSHQATLLIYLAANGVEIHRQKAPYNAVDIAQALLDAGADVHAKAKVYGGEYDVLALLASSDHPYKAGVGQKLEQRLKKPLAE